MGRIRSIKPEFFTSEKIASLPLSARLTFIGLWTYVDDNGVGLANEMLIAAAIWPLEPDHPETLRRVREDLRSLSGAALVRLYKVGQKLVIEIVNWNEHQRVSHPRKVRYPRFDQANGQPYDLRESKPAEVIPGNFRRDSGGFPDDLRREQGAGSREQGENIRSKSPRKRGTVRSSDDDRYFSLFWEVYPRKVAKSTALKAWPKARAKVDDPAAIIAGATRYRDDPGRDPAFTANPATWLNGERWNDEPTPPTVNGHRGSAAAAIIDRDIDKYRKEFRSS